MRNDCLGKKYDGSALHSRGRLSFELIKPIPEIVYTCNGYANVYDDFHDVAFDV